MSNKYFGYVLDLDLRSVHARDIGQQSRCIRHRSHFDHCLGAVQKRSKYLGIHILGSRLLFTGFRRCIEIDWIILAFAKTDNFKSHKDSLFVHHFADARLITGSNCIDSPGFSGHVI